MDSPAAHKVPFAPALLQNRPVLGPITLRWLPGSPPSRSKKHRVHVTLTPAPCASNSTTLSKQLLLLLVMLFATDGKGQLVHSLSLGHPGQRQPCSFQCPCGILGLAFAYQLLPQKSPSTARPPQDDLQALPSDESRDEPVPRVPLPSPLGPTVPHLPHQHQLKKGKNEKVSTL